MPINKDRKLFYEDLQYCTNRTDIEALIEKINDINLKESMTDKYNQILEFNPNENVKSIVKILEFSYLKFIEKR